MKHLSTYVLLFPVTKNSPQNHFYATLIMFVLLTVTCSSHTNVHTTQSCGPIVTMVTRTRHKLSYTYIVYGGCLFVFILTYLFRCSIASDFEVMSLKTIKFARIKCDSMHEDLKRKKKYFK